MSAPIATLFAAVLALIGVGINVLSAQVIRRQDKRAKQADWLRDKQVRDVEEIIPALNSFLADFTPQVEKLNLYVSTTSKTLEDLPDMMALGYVELNSGVTDALQENYAKYEETAKLLWELDVKRRSWFNFDAKRLSIWFENSDDIEKQLEELGEKIFEMNTAMRIRAKPLMDIVEETIKENGVVSYHTIERARELEKSFRTAIYMWDDVRDRFLRFQKQLAYRYKSSATDISMQSDNDGLLVVLVKKLLSLARKLEEGVRYVLR